MRRHVLIPNSFIEDSRISIEARSLAALIASFNEDRLIRRSELCSNAGIGVRKLEKLLNELDSKAPGLLTRKTMDGEPAYVLHFYGEPVLCTSMKSTS